MPDTRLRPLLRTVLTLLASLAVEGAAAQPGHAHVHGAVTLEIAVEPQAVSLRLEAPQDSLLGHERVPRGAAERQAAAALLQRLQGGAALFGLPAALQCRLGGVEVEAPLLLPVPAGEPAHAGSGHAEVAASYRFDCARTDGLRTLDLGGLLDAFPSIQQLGAQIAGTGGQHKAGLRRPARVLAWGR